MPDAELPAYEFSISPLVPSELNLLLSSWKLSLEEHRPQGLSRASFFRLQGAVIEDILSRYPLVLAARSLIDPELVLGWIAASHSTSGAIVWHCFVKEGYRRRGIAKRLLASVRQELPSDDVLYVSDTYQREAADRYAERVDVEYALKLQRRS